MESSGDQCSSMEIIAVADFESLQASLRQTAIDTYCKAFAADPYNENFTAEEANAALSFILEQRGDLLLGKIDGSAISFAGGYWKADGRYFIEELAVTPEYQGRGFGRQTLAALLRTDSARAANFLEVRTTAHNRRAIELYKSEGFIPQTTTEAVAQRRQGGGIAVDLRVYLSKSRVVQGTPPSILRRIAIAYPSGNTTAVVFDQMLSADRKGLNDRILASWHARNSTSPVIEQCCFIMPAHDPQAVARVEMFGGEFCGNATRSAAWLVTNGENYDGLIEVSGASEPLWFSIEDGKVTTEMPLPRYGDFAESIDEGFLVQLDGIAQLVVTDASQRHAQTPRELLEALLRDNKYDLANQPAMGVSYYDQSTSKAEFCVWVKEVATIFDETACGSGTCAVGVAVAMARRSSVNLRIVQPSGESITAGAEFGSASGRVLRAAISGSVEILYDGEFRL